MAHLESLKNESGNIRRILGDLDNKIVSTESRWKKLLKNSFSTENGKENNVKRTTKNSVVSTENVLKPKKAIKRSSIPLNYEATDHAKKVSSFFSKNKKTKNDSKKSLKVSDKSLKSVPKIPKGVRDIDSDDSYSLRLSDHSRDIYNYLRILEGELAIPESHLKTTNITPKMRSVLVDWLIQIHGAFKLSQETLYLTTSLVDRFLSVSSVVKRQLQLVGVTAMLIASKFEDIYPPDISDFVYVTDKTYTGEEIRSMEFTILRALKYRVNRPLPIEFLRRCSKAHLPDKRISIHSLSKYILECSILEYELAHVPPSLIAAASSYLAMKIENDDAHWSSTLEFFSGYSFSDMKVILQKLSKVVLNADKSDYKAPYYKYSGPLLGSVSCQEKLYSNKIRNYAEGKF